MMKRCSVGIVFIVASMLAGCNSHELWRPAARRFHGLAAEEFAIPSELATKCILVPVRFQNQEHLFMLDTGTTGIVLDEVFRPDLGKPIGRRKAWTPGGKKDFDLFEPPDAFWGSIDLRGGGAVACLDLSIFRSLLGYNVRGIIGMTVLGRLVVQIDFMNSKVIIMPPDGLMHPEWGKPVALGVGKGCLPTVKAHCPPAGEIVMMVDTGFSGNGLLARVDIQRLHESIQDARKDSYAVTLGGMAKGRRMRLPELRLGSFTYRDVEFTEGDISTLGLGFLSRHLVTFDFPNRKLYLKQVDNPNHPGKLYISGLVLKEQSGRLVIRTVIPGGPAEEAGAQAGDAILRIGDKDTQAMEMWEAAKLLISAQQKEVRLLIERGERTFGLSFVLRKGL